MAKIQIDDCWWSDPRRTALLLSIGFEADSAAVNMWRTAQEFWGKSRGLIPKEVFFKLKHAQALIDAGLADVRDGSVYVRGSSERFEWLIQLRKQASEAGKKSAESRRKKNGSAQPHGGKGRKKSERNPNENRTESERNRTESERNRTKSNLTITTTTTTTDSSNLKTTTTTPETTENRGDDPPSGGRSFGQPSDVLKFEARFRLRSEIEEVKPHLTTLFGGIIPGDIERRIPEILVRCNGDPKIVIEALEDLYQSAAIREGVGVKGSRSSYIAAAVRKRFGLEVGAS